MSELYLNLWPVAGITFIAEGLGLTLGISGFYLFNIKSRRMIGMLFGGTSGLMIAIICFDILKEALEYKRIDLVSVSIIIGIIIGLLLDNMVSQIENKIPIKKSSTLKMTVTLMVGIAIHNIAEGFAFGTIALIEPNTLVRFALVLSLHSMPEGIAMAIPSKKAKIKLHKMIGIAFMLGAVMSIGGLLGYILGSVSEHFIVSMMGVASGIILYIVCEELIPESRKMWNGRMTTVATILGIILGMLILG